MCWLFVSVQIKEVILISGQKINRNLTTIMIHDKFMLGPNFMGKEKPLVSGEELQVKSIDKTAWTNDQIHL